MLQEAAAQIEYTADYTEDQTSLGLIAQDLKDIAEKFGWPEKGAYRYNSGDLLPGCAISIRTSRAADNTIFLMTDVTGGDIEIVPTPFGKVVQDTILSTRFLQIAVFLIDQNAKYKGLIDSNGQRLPAPQPRFITRV